MVQTLNSDLMQRAVMDTTAMSWQPSPQTGVWRKRLDLIGSAEAGRVTSIVRYEAGASFPLHPHPQGEEILVLEGIFSDEFGDYPAGTYLLSPEGLSHAPFSEAGCTIFVKLRQYAGTTRQRLAIDTHSLPWTPARMENHLHTEGIEWKQLYAQPEYADRTRLERWQPGASLGNHRHSGGEEILVLEGTLADEFGTYGAGTWLRNPPGSAHAPFSQIGCLLYVKTGWQLIDAELNVGIEP